MGGFTRISMRAPLCALCVLCGRFSTRNEKRETRNEKLATSHCLSPHPIQTKRPSAVRCDVEEHEAIGHRQLAFVDDGPESVRSMRHEVGRGHRARGKK